MTPTTTSAMIAHPIRRHRRLLLAALADRRSRRLGFDRCEDESIPRRFRLGFDRFDDESISRRFRLGFDRFDDESIHVVIRGFYYLLQACQPDVAAMRSGMIYLGDTAGAGFKNYSLALEQRIAAVYSNAYPIRIQRMIFLNVPWLFRLFVRAWRWFVSPKVYQTFTYCTASDGDAVLAEVFSNNQGAMPAKWGGHMTTEGLVKQLEQNLQQRYSLAAKFKLGGNDDDDDDDDDETASADFADSLT